MKNTTLILAVFALVLSSCSKGTVTAISEKPTVITPLNQDLSAATLYGAKCASCHELQPREKYTATQWKRIVPEMAKLAKIDASQEAIILNYVLEAAKQ
jgi:hypothetical protein